MHQIGFEDKGGLEGREREKRDLDQSTNPKEEETKKLNNFQNQILEEQNGVRGAYVKNIPSRAR